MTLQAKALAVHLLTATGAVFAMLAMLEAIERDWAMMFVWLIVAFAVDGIDGPLARHYNVKTYAPQFDGVLLDLIIDYLTYVFIPAYALYASGLMDGWSGWAAIIVITFGSAMYFADTRMKTADNSFSGFPGCWNMVILVLFALSPPWQACLGLVAVLTVAMFVPVKFVHPVRTDRWRALTLPDGTGLDRLRRLCSMGRVRPDPSCFLGPHDHLDLPPHRRRGTTADVWGRRIKPTWITLRRHNA
jgi:phosphatidylcholine synthase